MAPSHRPRIWFGLDFAAFLSVRAIVRSRCNRVLLEPGRSTPGNSLIECRFERVSFDSLVTEGTPREHSGEKVMQFLLLCGIEGSRWEALSEVERARIMNEYGKLTRELKE